MTVSLAEKCSYQKNTGNEKLRAFAPKLLSLFMMNKGYTHIVNCFASNY